MSEPAPSTYLECIETTDQFPCGETYWWIRNPNDTNDWKLIVWFCNLHGCSQCANRRSKRNGRAVLEYVGKRPCHHLTLTVARNRKPLRHLLEHLRTSFRTLNRRPRWKRSIIGGIWFLDCTYDEGTDAWGPHLHVIVEADELPGWLEAAWLEITGDSWQVGARAIDVDAGSRAGTVYYASKVAYKQFADNPSAMAEYLEGVKGKRKSQPFGKWYGKLKLNPRRAGRKTRLAEPPTTST
ncbi:hypothetical protein BH09PLA1_BH09PLA1_01530 [soil metagenome]